MTNNLVELQEPRRRAEPEAGERRFESAKVPPEVLIFDLSEVLISGLMGIEPELSAKLGLPRDVVHAAFPNRGLDEWLRGEIAEDVYLERVIACENWDIAPTTIKELIRRTLQRRIPGMDELVVRLSRSYELVLFADHVKEYVDYIIATHPFLCCFKTKIFSCYCGKTKRDESSFRQMLSSINRLPRDCLFIDDSPSNVERAAEVGVPSVLFVGRAMLERYLEAMGLLS